VWASTRLAGRRGAKSVAEPAPFPPYQRGGLIKGGAEDSDAIPLVLLPGTRIYSAAEVKRLLALPHDEFVAEVQKLVAGEEDDE
jgi:hypothetical protein